jgi:hypothetical protein
MGRDLMECELHLGNSDCLPKIFLTFSFLGLSVEIAGAACFAVFAKRAGFDFSSEIDTPGFL